MAKRKYAVKGTNDFLVLGAIFFFLCLWAVKDAWFPGAKVLKKHPHEVVASFEVAGTIEKVLVNVGDTIGKEQVIAKLRSDRVSVEYDKAKGVYTETNKKHTLMEVALKNLREGGGSDEGIAEREESLGEAKIALDAALVTVNDLRLKLDSSDLKAPDKGKILEVRVETHTMVEAGDAVLVIEPADHFYVFNKSLAIFSFIGFWVFLAVHILER